MLISYILLFDTPWSEQNNGRRKKLKSLVYPWILDEHMHPELQTCVVPWPLWLITHLHWGRFWALTRLSLVSTVDVPTMPLVASSILSDSFKLENLSPLMISPHVTYLPMATPVPPSWGSGLPWRMSTQMQITRKRKILSFILDGQLCN